jgi:hypothetical protein
MVTLRSGDSDAMYRTAEVGKDGQFEFPHVAPGSYTLVATTDVGAALQIARQKVEVRDTDIDGLRLTPLAWATVRGRLHLGGKAEKIDLSLLFVAPAKDRRRRRCFGHARV